LFSIVCSVVFVIYWSLDCLLGIVRDVQSGCPCYVFGVS
jgi:hypothetical protein